MSNIAPVFLVIPKAWGDDDRLVKSIVVMSSAQAIMNTEIGISELKGKVCRGR